MLSRGMVRKLVLSMALGIAVLVALSAAGDFHKTLAVMGSFAWQYLPIALALTVVNYLLRFAKWHFYLQLVEAKQVGLILSALIFFSTFSMVMTPGKVGEWLKSYLLRETAGTPVGLSAPIVIAERLTDGLAMVVLASGGLFLYGFGWQVLVAAIIPAAVAVVLSQQPRAASAAIRIAQRVPILSKKVHHLQHFYESSQRLFRPRNVIIAVVIGLVSWSGEALAFYSIMRGLGFPPSFELLVQVTFVLTTSTLAGAIALTPGGLAVAEGSMAGLLMLLGVTSQASVAAAATMLIRLCTLWFGLAIGVVFLALMARSLGSFSALGPEKAPVSGG